MNPVDDYLASIEDGIDGLRVGVIREIDIENLAPSVRSDWEASLERLSSAGARLQEVSIPHLHSTVAVYYVIANSEASANLARYDGIRFGPRITGSDMIDSVKKTRALFGSEVKRRIMLGTYALSAGYYDEYYGRALKVRTLIKQDFLNAFEQVDVIATPTTPTTAFKIGQNVDDPLSMYLQDIFTLPVNLSASCGISVPCGFDSQNLPIGLQLIGNALKEATILNAAFAYEQATEWHKQAPVKSKQ